MIVDPEEISEIFKRITEEYEEPVPIGNRCESRIYYRTEDLTEEDLNTCARYVAQRIKNVASPQEPHFFLKLPGGYSFFAERLSAMYSELFLRGKELPVEQYLESKLSNGHSEKYKGKNAILVTDVITTARSSLEAHTKATIRGIPVLCWATLIDRTFGPGPVSVVSSYTGAPVRVLAQIG
jgi:hypoxanthine-guanine phosphoribosyltransferase